jgi:orotidine-5'-phosphate decarboxylase
MTYETLYQEILAKKSYLCIGLDTDINLIPPHFSHLSNPLLAFNQMIIEATADLCVAYKINTAFYESMGAKGWEIMEKTLNLIPETHLTIADAKRGDIGNTVTQYAKAFFEQMQFDAVTVAPYMGADSVKPFLQFAGKWVILLALTSNSSAKDFQFETLTSGERLFEKVLQTSQNWADKTQMMYVVGATQTEELAKIRTLAPEHFLLVPGIGAQGGSLAEVSNFGMNKHCGLLVNVSRSIIYASQELDFADKARQAAQALQEEMAIYLEKNLEKIY